MFVWLFCCGDLLRADRGELSIAVSPKQDGLRSPDGWKSQHTASPECDAGTAFGSSTDRNVKAGISSRTQLSLLSLLSSLSVLCVPFPPLSFSLSFLPLPLSRYLSIIHYSLLLFPFPWTLSTISPSSPSVFVCFACCAVRCGAVQCRQTPA